MRILPPPKKAGQATGPRRFAGEVLDVHEAAALLGASEKVVRARVARRLLPFRRSGGRIVFLREELLEFYRQLPGCTLMEAMRAQKDRMQKQDEKENGPSSGRTETGQTERTAACRTLPAPLAQVNPPSPSAAEPGA